MISKAPYSSKSLSTFEEQVQLLESRGLLIGSDENRKFLIEFLSNLNFYRFEGYCLRYYDKNARRRKFISGTSFMRIQSDYYADKKIRLETFEIIQDFEISLRAQFVNILGLKYGAFPYKAEYYHTDENGWEALYENHLLSAVNKSNENYVKKFAAKYPNELPSIWIMIELLSFGELSQIYRRYLKNEERIAIATHYAVNDSVLESWLHCITLLRNKCAHHSKLIDTSSPTRAAFPKEFEIKKYNHLMQRTDSKSLCALILILCYLAEAIGRKGLAAAYLIKIENIINDMNLEESQLGFPKDMTIKDIKEELGFTKYVLNKPEFK